MASVDDTAVHRMLSKLEEIAQRAGKSEQTFVYEVFIHILFEGQDWIKYKINSESHPDITSSSV